MDELQKGKITVLPIENLSMIREITLLYHKDFKHTNILDGLLEEYNKLVKSYNH